MKCFEICVRGVAFRIWAPTIEAAMETFMIDMDYHEVPADCVEAEVVRCCTEMPKNITPGF